MGSPHTHQCDRRNSVVLETPAGYLYDGTASATPRIGRMEHMNAACFALTFEVDVAGNSLAIQGLWPFFVSAMKGLTPAQLAETVVRTHQSCQLPTGWMASPVLTVTLPATADLSQCAPLCGLWGPSVVCEVQAPAQWLDAGKT
jgi:hypothetical protein